MDNDILIYTAGFVAVRVAAVVAFGYAIFHVLASSRARGGRQPAFATASARANAGADDRC